MLKLKSAFLGLCVFVQMGNGLTGSSSCRANDELLPDFADEVRSISTGSEKGCASDLPVPGVSFPTRLYSQHAAAYGTRLITLVPVHAGLLPETDIEGCRKSEDELFTMSDEIEVIARNAENDTSFAVGEISEVKTSGWRAARPRKIEQGFVDFEMGEFSAIVAEPTPEESENPLQTVAYQETSGSEEIAPMVPPMPPGPTEDAATKGDIAAPQKSDGLFSILGKVSLGAAIHSADELPDELNEGKEYFSKAGTQRNWSSGTWVSFRPRRNTFPFHHNPLYFEDPNLERCGRTSGYFTEVTSFAHFAGRIPVLPYMMTVEPPCSLVHAKPDCPTCSEFGPDAYIPNPDEIDLGGASIQAVAVVGLIFLIP